MPKMATDTVHKIFITLMLCILFTQMVHNLSPIFMDRPTCHMNGPHNLKILTVPQISSITDFYTGHIFMFTWCYYYITLTVYITSGLYLTTRIMHHGG